MYLITSFCKCWQHITHNHMCFFLILWNRHGVVRHAFVTRTLHVGKDLILTTLVFLGAPIAQGTVYCTTNMNGREKEKNNLCRSWRNDSWRGRERGRQTSSIIYAQLRAQQCNSDPRKRTIRLDGCPINPIRL